MPAPKKTTSTAVATRAQSSAVVSIKEQLAAQAAAVASKTAPPTGVNIRITQDKHFTLPNGLKTREPLRLVILDFISKNSFYAGAYDPNAISAPDCFALADSPRGMVPHESSPNPQASDCDSCPMNQFGSAGAGKACKNTRLLAVTPADEDDGPIWVMAVSPTAIKGFDAYVNDVQRVFALPPVGVVTTVGFDESQTYARLTFSDPEPNNQLEAHFAKQGQARELLERLPDFSAAQAAPKATAARGRAVRTPVRVAAVRR